MSTAVIEKRNGVSTAGPDVGLDPEGAAVLLEENSPVDRKMATIPPSPRPKRRQRIVLTVLLCIAAAGAIAGGTYLVHSNYYASTDDAFIDGHVIQISPQVAARVQSLAFDDNSLVKKGDVLVKLDPTDFQVALDQAMATAASKQAKLEQARTQVTGAKAALQAAEAGVAVAKANASSVKSDYRRFQALSAGSPGAVSKQQFDSTEAEERSTDAQIDQATAKVAQAQSDIATAEASVQAAVGDVAKAEADRHKAAVNLSYCTIMAPDSGRITRKNVEPGSYVEVGQELFAVVPTNVWVVANFKETQLNSMRVGQPVTLSVDAYPDLELHGKVDSMQLGTGSRFSMLPAENATGNFVKVVQRVPVKIVLDGNPGDDATHPLAPGMSVEPEVRIR